jgi:hypothetical protein
MERSVAELAVNTPFKVAGWLGGKAFQAMCFAAEAGLFLFTEQHEDVRVRPTDDSGKAVELRQRAE